MPKPTEEQAPGIVYQDGIMMVQASWFMHGELPLEHARVMQRRMISAATGYYREWKIKELREGDDGDDGG